MRIRKTLYCSMPNCAEQSFREYPDLDEAIRFEPEDKRWKCRRHDETTLLTPGNARIEWVSAPNGPSKTFEGLPRTMLFFGHDGMLTAGPIRAFAKDFPAGTRIRITMEAIVPVCACCLGDASVPHTCGDGGK